MALKYDLYTTAAGGTLVASNINTGYSHAFTGTDTFYVKTRNSIGDEIDSNQDSGTGVPAYMYATYVTSGLTYLRTYDNGNTKTGFELSEDNGVTWIAQADYGLLQLPYANTWIIRKTDGPMNITRYNTTNYDTKITSAVIDAVGSTTMQSMFAGCDLMTTCDLSNFDTSALSGGHAMHGVFSGCSSLTSIDVSGFNLSNVSNIDSMFNGCSSLTTLDLSAWNTTNITSISSMFYRCNELTTININNWDVNKITSVSSTFDGCVKLTTLISNNTNKIKLEHGAQSTFRSCASLTSLDLTNWDFSEVDYFNSIFSGCTDLTCITNIDTSKWGAQKDNMFVGCNALIQPDIAAINDLTDSDGANWTNPGACP